MPRTKIMRRLDQAAMGYLTRRARRNEGHDARELVTKVDLPAATCSRQEDLARGGVLVVDDGTLTGARDATDAYLRGQHGSVLRHRVDFAVRQAIRP